ncbi:MAG TPA: ABC transporter substrate-binding protein [Pseudolabrys sp.]|nr:ABC transporter substrate-binding protein [Pseudolabrys sp.]
MRRRDFTAFLVGYAAMWPLHSYAQQPRKIPRIGVLLPGGPASSSPRTKAFLDGLKDLGRVEGKTITIEWKWGDDRVDTFPERAVELVRSNVDVIVTGGTPAAKALKATTQTIPIVMAVVGDPVAAGLVDNLARPGGNVTGFSIIAPELGTKRLELLKEIVPNLSSIAVLSNPKNPQSKIEMKEIQTAAQAMGLQLYLAETSTERGLEDAFAAIKKAGAQALILLTDSIFFSERKRTVELAGKYRLPSVYFFPIFVEEGGLLSYGPSDADLFRRAAGYVDRILKGAKPGELPVEQPTKFDLYINLKAAKALGVTIPESFLACADKVIE